MELDRLLYDSLETLVNLTNDFTRCQAEAVVNQLLHLPCDSRQSNRRNTLQLLCVLLLDIGRNGFVSSDHSQ